MPLLSIAISSGNDRHLRHSWRRWLAAVALGLVVITVAATSALQMHRHSTQSNAPPLSTLDVTSMPAGATVLVDGRRRGRTPTQLSVPPGDRHVTFQGSSVVPATVEVPAIARQTAMVKATLWLRTPALDLLRTPFPGASVASANFLADGRVSLTVNLPPGDEHQLWVRARDGGLQRIGPSMAYGTLAASPDGGQVAYLAPTEVAAAALNGPATRLTAVRIASSDGQHDRQRFAVDAGTSDQLTDLAWSPDGSHLLLVVRLQENDGGIRTQLRWLDVVQGRAPTLAELPSAVVPGSILWSPHGDTVAFLTQSGSLVSVCLLGTAPPSFRYLADLGHNDTKPLPFPPVAWSAEGTSLVYAAPIQAQVSTLGDRLFAARAAPALFSTTMSGPASRRLGTSEGDAPVWRADGSLLALARSSRSGPIALQAVDPGTGRAARLGTLPVSVAPAYAVHWDATHGQALLAQRTDGGSVEYLLLSFMPEADR